MTSTFLKPFLSILLQQRQTLLRQAPPSQPISLTGPLTTWTTRVSKQPITSKTLKPTH